MTTGIARDSGHVSLVETWTERTERVVFKAKEERLRARVAELYEAAGVASPKWRKIVKRALVESEGLLDLAADALRRDWLER